jgi:flagellar basal-body rod protein FlgB
VASILLPSLGMKTLFDSVDQMQSALTFHRERQAVLAGNLANLETPGYRSMDLERVDASVPGNLPMAVTREGHLDVSGGLEGTMTAFADGDNVGADGNSVNLERELAKVDANRVRYTTTAELASRRLALLRYTSTDGA